VLVRLPKQREKQANEQSREELSQANDESFIHAKLRHQSEYRCIQLGEKHERTLETMTFSCEGLHSTNSNYLGTGYLDSRNTHTTQRG
jgi:hypothetical protein